MESHPRHETEQKRVYARRKLRNLAETKLKTHGSPFPTHLLPFFGAVDLVVADIRFEDGAEGHLSRIKIFEEDVVKINIYHTDDRLGPFTQYTSYNSGEFTRSDQNPLEGGALSQEEIESLGVGMIDASLHGALIAAIAQVENRDANIDDHPISAQEAWEVIDRIKTAEIAQP